MRGLERVGRGEVGRARVARDVCVPERVHGNASAEVLVDSVLIILEQAINGVQDMRYMASAATSAGEGAIQIIF